MFWYVTVFKNTFPLEKSMMFILSLVKNAPENESKAEKVKLHSNKDKKYYLEIVRCYNANLVYR